MTQRSSGSFFKSLIDAFRGGNILLRLVLFFFFGIITATEYFVNNLDKVPSAAKATGESGFWYFLEFGKALLATTAKGMWLGFSTLFNALLHIKEVFNEPRIGTIIFSGIVLIFGTASMYQPVSLFFNAIDLHTGREFHPGFILLASIAVTIIASMAAWGITGGETITSSIESSVQADVDVSQNVSVPVNSSINESKIVKSLDMLVGG